MEWSVMHGVSNRAMPGEQATHAPRPALIDWLRIGPLVLGVLGAVAIVGAGVVLVIQTQAALVETGRALTGQLADLENRSNGLLFGLADQTIMFSKMPPIAGIGRALEHGMIDPESGDTIEAWKQRLGKIFEAAVEAHPDFLQLRLIGVREDGREIVRVDRDPATGTVRQIEDEELQAKGGRDYFREALDLPAGQVAMSDIDLNQEHGVVAVPEVPTIRSSTPVRTSRGEVFGAVVINLHLGRFLDWLAHDIGAEGTVVVTDATGQPILHPDPGRAFAHERAASAPPGAATGDADDELASIGPAALWGVAAPAGLEAVRTAEGRHLLVLRREIPLPNDAGGRRIGVMVWRPLSAVRASALHGALPPLLAMAGLWAGFGLLVFRRDAWAARQELRHKERVRGLERLLLGITDNSTVGLIVFDREARYLAANPAYGNLVGRRLDEIVGRRLEEVVGSEAMAVLEPLIGRVLGGEHVATNLTLTYPLAGTRVLQVNLTPNRSSVGVDGWFACIIDVTELTAAQAALREREQFQQSLLSGAGDAIIAGDPSGLITLFNPAAERLLGYAAEEMVGRLTLAVFHDPDEVADRARTLSMELGRTIEPGFEVFVAKVREGEAETREWTYVRKDGSRVDVLLTVSALRGDAGEITGYLGVTRDISVRKQLEQELRDQQGRLEETVRSRTAELEIARDAAEAATRAKSNFLTHMSHEIRTPMSVIAGYAELLLDPHSLPADWEATAQAISHNSQHLLGVINDILDLARIEAGKLPVELSLASPWEIARTVVEMVRGQARDKQIALTLTADGPLPRRLQTDPTRVRQILINYLSNALKFKPSGRRVAVGVAVQAAPRAVCLSVADEGIGMSPEQMERLFQPFEQGDPSITRQYGGSGLGLSICRLLAESMGATIDVRSDPGKGSTFRLLLPLAEDVDLEPVPPPDAGGRRSTEPASAAQPADGGKILLVEDSPELRKLMTFRLTRAGYEVATADNGQLGVELALRESFDAILMDIQMPVMDGQTATVELRRSGYTGPIIGLSAHAMTGEREKNLALGMNDYLTKPVEVEELLQSLRRLRV